MRKRIEKINESSKEKGKKEKKKRDKSGEKKVKEGTEESGKNFFYLKYSLKII